MKNPANYFDINTGINRYDRKNDVTSSNVMEMKTDVTKRSPFSDLLRNLALDFIIDNVGDQCKSIVSVYLTIIYHSGNHIKGSIQEDLHESRSLNWERIAGDNKAVSYFFHLLHFVHSIVRLKKHLPCLMPE